MGRRIVGFALVGVGAILVLLSAGLVGYARWAEWQHGLQGPAAPQETLPERLEVEASALIGFDEQAQAHDAPGPTAPPPRGHPVPARFDPLAVGAPIQEWAAPAPLAATPEPMAAGSLEPVPGSPTAATAADAWLATLGPLEAVWETDWPAAIARLEDYHARFPDEATATEKLYAALVTYGQALVERGRVPEGIAALERAQALQPGRGEGAAALIALTPTPNPPPAGDPASLATVGTPARAPARPAARAYGRPVAISIPRIGVNSRVAPVTVAGGEYLVPAWDVGFHADSAAPGAGNSVFNGHVHALNGGQVFKRLREVQPGDAVYLYTSDYRLDWVVQAVRTVPNTEYRYILPSGDIRITLYTCTGQLNPLTRDFSHRLVVVGALVQASPRG